MLLKNAVPQEPVRTGYGNALPAPGHHSRSGPLSPTDLAFLRHSLAHRQRRRHAYRAGPLRVAWDGVAQGHVVPRDRVGGPFHVRLRTVSLDIVGEDAEGTLLLAVVPLPAPAAVEAEGTIQRSVTLDGGQRLTLDITLGAGTRGEAGVYVIHLTAGGSAPETSP